MKETPPPVLNIQLHNGFSFDMLLVEGGEFVMGDDDSPHEDEKPAHPVKLDGFYLGKFPVTQALWQAVMKGEEHPSRFQGAQRPKTNVSWDDIKRDFLPAIQRITGMPFRLPSEAEWEYAARGGRFPSGMTKYAGSGHLDEVGWYNENSYDETKAVGLKLPNELGLYDLSGNVWEWCEDDWHGDYKKAPGDGTAWVDSPERGYYRVQRGGSYFDSPVDCRAAYRGYYWPENRSYDIGFRLALSPQFSP